MLIGFGEGDDIPLFILFIHRDEIIRKRKFWERSRFKITKSHLSEFSRYELIYELERLKKLLKKEEQEELNYERRI